MNIVVISGLYSLQPKSGGSLVMKLYVNELRKQGHRVTLLYDTSEDDDPLSASREAGNYYLPAINNAFSAQRNIVAKLLAKMRQFTSSLRRSFLSKNESEVHQYAYPDLNYLKVWIEQFSRGNKIDVIQVDFPWLMNVPAFLPAGIPTVFVSHEIQAVRFEREANQMADARKKREMLEKSALYRQYETQLASKFDAIFTLTNADRDIWQLYLPAAKVMLSPLGINIPGFNSIPGSKAEKLVFVGSGKHFPNVDALQYFFAEIWPAIAAKNKSLSFYITGEYEDDIKNAAPKSDRIIWAGFVKDLPAFMHNAVSIVPVRIGSGIRIKILESMAMGAPVVSTTMGAEGIMARNGESILLADDAAEFALKVLALFNDAGLYRSIGTQGRQMVMDHYNVQTTVENRIGLFKSL